MRKRLFTILLASTMLLLLLLVGVNAASVVASGDCGAKSGTVKWTLNSDGLLTISGNGAMADFSYGSAAPWYSRRDSIKTAVISEGVTNIGTAAFYSCENMTGVTIPKNVTSIGDYAFQYCASLNGMTIPSGVKSIGTFAFSFCRSLTGVNIPNGVIGDYAFSNCNKLSSLTLGSSVTSIGERAFENCSSLTGVTIPKSVTSIGDRAFLDCSTLANIIVDEGNASYSSTDGVLFNKAKTTLLYCPIPKAGAYTIPGSVTTIGDNAFCKCSGLTSVTIPNSVTTIGETAFEDCANMTIATIPNSVTTIGSCAFRGCDALTDVNIPYGITTINYGTFEYCGSLTSVTIPDSVTTIDEHAFDFCYSMISVTIGNRVTSIGNYAFHECFSLASVNIPDSVTTIGASAFYNCQLHSVNIPKNVTTIGKNAFADCDDLTDVYYGGSEAQWHSITIGSNNDYLINATIHYNEQGEDPATPFSDVAAGKFYYQPVLWAVENGITNGITATTFEPNENCTRGQVVTFLWRAAGKPEPKSSSNPFTDVVAGKFYYKAVLWAVEQGITSGMTKTTFEPNSPCTRGQVVTFQWRAAGKPDPESASNSFTDVPAGKFYSKAVLWAVENGITSGMSKTTFVPDNICTRGQIVTFLYRQYS